MKLRFQLFWLTALLPLLALFGPTAALRAAPTDPAAKAAAPAQTNAAALQSPIPRSVFVIPGSPQDGRDPFFPESTRIYKTNVKPTGKSVAGDVVVKGFSGTSKGPLVILNDHTFGPGDEGDVTAASGRVHIRCLSINLKDETVLIEANGERRELRLSFRNK